MLFKFFDISSLEYKFLVNSTAKLAIKTESPKLFPIFFPQIPPVLPLNNYFKINCFFLLKITFVK